MKRILYVNQTGQVSGAEHSLLTLLRCLEGRVEPLVACPEGELADAVREIGIEHFALTGTQASFRLHPVHTFRGVSEVGRSALEVRDLAKRLRPDLIHANTLRAALISVLARRSDPPIVAHIREWAPQRRFPRFVLGFVGRRADALVANSTVVGAQFDGVPVRHPVRVIHNPVDLKRFDPAEANGPAVRRELGISASTVVLSVVGQLAPLKGQDDAIESFASLFSRGCDAELLLVGSAKFAAPGTELDNVAFERRLHSLAAASGVAERVRFLGERKDVPDVLAATDIALMPFWREGFGRVAVEAMAMGVPVVAAAVGGPLDIVTPGEDGLLLPPKSPEVWAAELLPLIRDRELRAALGERGRKRARDFDATHHARAVAELYDDLCTGDSAPDASL